MTDVNDLLRTIRDAGECMSLADLLVRHPDVARRTAQRWISQHVGMGVLVARGEARAPLLFQSGLQYCY